MGRDLEKNWFVRMKIVEFQNETQGPSTPELCTESAHNSSAQDDTVFGGRCCFVHADVEFEAILRVLAEC